MKRNEMNFREASSINTDTRAVGKEFVAYPGDSRSLRLEEPFSGEHYKDRPGTGVRSAPFVPCASIRGTKYKNVGIERVRWSDYNSTIVIRKPRELFFRDYLVKYL